MPKASFLVFKSMFAPDRRPATDCPTRKLNPLCWGVFALLILSCASGHHASFEGSLVRVRNVEILEARLNKAVSASKNLMIAEIGRVRYPGFEAPIWCVSFRPAQVAPKRILINGGVHGNEPAGVECAVELVELLARQPDTFAAAAIDVIPLINPWGWTYDIRFNQAGIDINRDMASFQSQETKIITEAIKKKTYDLMLDLHEDPSAQGFYLYQYGLADRIFSEKVIEAVHEMGHPIEQNVNMVILKTQNGIIDAPLWGLRYMRLTGQLSLANYYRLHNSSHVFTIETPTHLAFEDRLAIQARVVAMLINKYGNKN